MWGLPSGIDFPVSKRVPGSSGGLVNKHLFFFKSFLKHPNTVGAVAPSSRVLARAMVEGKGLDRASCVVEYGPGLGSFTKEILARKGRGTLYVGIEKNPEFVEVLRREFPEGRFLVGDAGDVGEILAGMGIFQVDLVVSGLPFANFPPQVQRRILETTCAVLKPGGSFVTFNYIHTWPLQKAKAFREKISGVFDRVTWRPVMLNVPPAFVVNCRKGNVTCPCGRLADCHGLRLAGKTRPEPSPAPAPERVVTP